MEEFYWTRIAESFIQSYPEQRLELAEIMLTHLGVDGSIVGGFHSETLTILNHIMTESPREVWGIAAKYLGPPIDTRAFKIKNWLQEGQFEANEGVLSSVSLDDLWGWVDHDVTWQVCRHYMAPLVDEDVDSVVLGCTHYPVLKDVIAGVLGPEVALIDSAEEVARDVTQALDSKGMKDESSRGSDLFEVTDSAERFAEVGRIFLNRELPNVRHVTLEE